MEVVLIRMRQTARGRYPYLHRIPEERSRMPQAGKRITSGGRPHFTGEGTRETTASCSVKSGFVGIPWSDSSDANLTLEANKHMQAELRQRKSETELAALSGPRTPFLSLILPLKRYHRTGARHIQTC